MYAAQVNLFNNEGGGGFPFVFDFYGGTVRSMKREEDEGKSQSL